MAQGWVYVITNKAMPDLVKVGYTMKDPALRAEELYGTGAPHRYQVAYEMLIDTPYETERKAHSKLSDHREAKEWFRCSVEHAIATIQEVANGAALLENFKQADREKTAAMRSEQLMHAEREKLLVDAIAAERAAISGKYSELLKAAFQPSDFWPYWLGCGFGLFFVFAVMFPKANDGALFFWSIALGAVAALYVQKWSDGRRKKKSKHDEISQEMTAALESANKSFSSCNRCSKIVRIPDNFGDNDWICPSCNRRNSSQPGRLPLSDIF